MQADGGCSSQLGSASEVMDHMQLMGRMDALIAKWTSEDLMDGSLPLTRGAAAMLDRPPAEGVWLVCMGPECPPAPPDGTWVTWVPPDGT